ncbi:hypothetical protein HMPREF1573_00301 [Gardnerella vaginalis JCP7276]|uniref:Uncharacterized protein n=1 Tax=Gardnerella vaginalis 1400E TaxID=698956 RepID=I4LV02_GARVA|nr:hypothetical protein CGSMWGv1400E_03840 [Gardnerella vaginalis 1400E]EPI57341.1 hypothetical protein HMPREF1573_00301 [Gardnerella vaginalis JCP7276]
MKKILFFYKKVGIFGEEWGKMVNDVQVAYCMLKRRWSYGS